MVSTTAREKSGLRFPCVQRGIAAGVVCLLALAASRIPAQQAAPTTNPPQTIASPPDPATRQGAPESPQQPGGAQVHTGVTSGLDTDARLRNLLADHQFIRLESQLDQLAPEQAQFYRGVLANRDNDLKTSVQLLEPLVDQVTASGDKPKEKLLRKTLAEDYLRMGDLAKANKAYQTLETRLQGQLTADEQDELEMPVKLLPLAAANPPMTVEPYDPFKIQAARNPIGLTDLPVYVDARPHSFMLDPTAPFNLISRSIAKEVGLTVSADAATIHSLTGRPIQVHVTVIPRFTIGGLITFRNMTAFVFEDADYAFPQTRYQVEGVLGYAAMSALGSLTITGESTIEVRPFKPLTAVANEDHPAPGARFFLDGDQMIVALGAADQERMYVLDAGGQHTYLTSRYFDEHTGDFAGQKMEMFSLPDAPGTAAQPAYNAETVPLAFGPIAANIHYIRVLTQPPGTAALDDVYGVLGLDALDQFLSYTFDYRTMTFSVKAE